MAYLFLTQVQWLQFAVARWRFGRSVEYFIMTDYSYASVSLTVSCEALRAGSALATVARKSVKISHAIIPLMP